MFNDPIPIVCGRNRKKREWISKSNNDEVHPYNLLARWKMKDWLGYGKEEVCKEKMTVEVTIKDHCTC